MKYHFDEKIAKEVGVEEAIMYSNIHYRCTKNKANGSKKHYHDGRWWTYNSQKAFVDLFPFWTKKQIRRILENLIEAGLIKKGEYNKNKYDRTAWYSALMNDNDETGKSNGTEGLTDMPKWAGQGDHMGQPIPNNKPYSNPYKEKKYIKKENSSHKQEKKKEKKHSAQKKEKRFLKKPTLEEIKKYIQEKKLKHINAEQFFYFYDSKDWYVGKSKMKNWKSALSGRNARNRDNEKEPSSPKGVKASDL